MTISVEPLEDRVLVRPIPESDTTKGGIHLPTNAKEKPVRGTVVAVGLGKQLENGTRLPMPVVAGDIVVYSKYAGTDIRVEDEDMLLLRASDLVCKLREE